MAEHTSVVDSAPESETELGDESHIVDLLIESTWAVTAQSGTVEPSVRDILENAGLSTKAFYRNFRSKDELLLAAFERGAVVLVDYLDHRMADLPDPLARIGAWVEGCMRQTVNPVASRRAHPWAVEFGRIAMTYPDQFNRYQARITAPLQAEIERAVDLGLCRSPDPAHDARLIFGFTMYSVRTHFINGTVPTRADLEHLVGFAHRALAPHPA
jgi:AcrR family transcriptional regulator